MPTPAERDNLNLIIEKIEDKLNESLVMGSIISICTGILIMVPLYYFGIEIKF